MVLAIRSKLGKLDIITPTTPFPTAPKNFSFFRKKGWGWAVALHNLRFQVASRDYPAILTFRPTQKASFTNYNDFLLLFIYFIFIYFHQRTLHTDIYGQSSPVKWVERRYNFFLFSGTKLRMVRKKKKSINFICATVWES